MRARACFVSPLDPKTGWARNVTVIKSTDGHRSTSQAVLSGLRELRMRPGKWKHVDFPVVYKMFRSREEAMEEMRDVVRPPNRSRTKKPLVAAAASTQLLATTDAEEGRENWRGTCGARCSAMWQGRGRMAFPRSSDRAVECWIEKVGAVCRVPLEPGVRSNVSNMMFADHETNTARAVRPQECVKPEGLSFAICGGFGNAAPVGLSMGENTGRGSRADWLSIG